jgi:hypothetical protein
MIEAGGGTPSAASAMTRRNEDSQIVAESLQVVAAHGMVAAFAPPIIN